MRCIIGREGLRLRWLAGAFGALAVAVVSACSDISGPEAIVSKLVCEGAGGTLNECALLLSEGGGFTITLQSVSCTAHGNRVRLTQPVAYAQTLTDDGCYEVAPRAWNIGGTLGPGSTIAIEVESARLENDPVLRVTGEFPEWLIEFEDGGDDDFDDLVFTIRANVTS
jgi:hypothetical protein